MYELDVITFVNEELVESGGGGSKPQKVDDFFRIHMQKRQSEPLTYAKTAKIASNMQKRQKLDKIAQIARIA